MTPALVTVLLILHGLLGVALLGAITHQSFGVIPGSRGQGPRSFLDRFAQIDASAYTNAVILLFIITSIGGAILYAPYRVDVRPALEDRQLVPANASFEIKEHLAAIGMGLLPAYWVFWRKTAVPAEMPARRYLTWMIAFCTWWNFIVGHVLNNIKGLI